MAESKSNQFINNINTHSEKIAKSDPLSINRLLADSECDQCDRCPLLRSLFGVKRTCPFALQMSAFDPKRTWTSVQYETAVNTRALTNMAVRIKPNV